MRRSGGFSTVCKLAEPTYEPTRSLWIYCGYSSVSSAAILRRLAPVNPRATFARRI